MTDTDGLIEFHKVVFKRGDRTILDGLDMRFEKGKLTSILGPSGCGKTTVLKLIGGQLRPDEGKLLVYGKDLKTMNRSQLHEIRKKMGFLFQTGALFSDLDVFENIAYPLREHTNLNEAMIRDVVLMKLNAVGLRGARDLMPSELSGGMKRRVALARTIVLDPAIVMFDEPFAGQDPVSKGVLVKLVKTMIEILGLTGILVSHDIHEVLAISDYVYLISGGKIVGEGAPKTLMEDKNPWVQQFTQGLPDGPVPFHYPVADLSDELLWSRDD